MEAFKIQTVEDVAQIPDEYLREFSQDCMRTIIELEPLFALMGTKFGGINFKPDGLGELKVRIKPNKIK